MELIKRKQTNNREVYEGNDGQLEQKGEKDVGKERQGK